MIDREGSWFVALVLTLVCGLAASASAEHVVVAGAHQASNPPPFVAGDGRFQFVYGSALFAGPVRISALAFSPTADVAAIGGTIAIHLGVTARAVDGLTGDLDANATGPLTEVFDQGVAFVDVFGATDFFALAFPFDRPFDYDPADGNLLVDVVTFDVAFSSPVVLSARTAGDDLGSRAIDHPDVGTGADTISPRISFTVPEPAGTPFAAAAVLFGFAALRGRRWALPAPSRREPIVGAFAEPAACAETADLRTRVRARHGRDEREAR